MPFSYLACLRQQGWQPSRGMGGNFILEYARWVEVRPYGTDAQPERIVERSGSENLYIHDAIVACLVKLGKSHRFGSRKSAHRES